MNNHIYIYIICIYIYIYVCVCILINSNDKVGLFWWMREWLKAPHAPIFYTLYMGFSQWRKRENDSRWLWFPAPWIVSEMHIHVCMHIYIYIMYDTSTANTNTWAPSHRRSASVLSVCYERVQTTGNRFRSVVLRSEKLWKQISPFFQSYAYINRHSRKYDRL